MAEPRSQTTAWPPSNVATALTTEGIRKRGTNPAQDSFIRLEEAEQLRQHRKLDRAQRICESLLREHPDYMAALHTLGLIYADRDNYDRALDCLVRAAMLNPRSWKTLTALSGVYLRLGAREMAAQTLEQARRIEPRDPNVLVTLGEIYFEEREYKRSLDAYRQAFELEPTLLPAALGLGWVYSFVGQNLEAAKVFEGLIERKLRRVEPVFALATLPAPVVSIDLLAELDKALREEAGAADAEELENTAAFARAAAFDAVGRHAEAWEQLVSANRKLLSAKSKQLDDSIRLERADLAWLRNNSIQVMRSAGGGAHTISLFILGPSRSGKTSMEQLVSALDGVKRGYESPLVENAIRRAFQTAGLLTSSFLENLPAQLHSLCRDIFLEELDRRARSARVFTNTHPAHIHDAARIANMFPNVRFICVKRNMEDTLLRTYMRKYGEGNPHAYSLQTARDHLVWYYEMMDLLAEKLPDIVRVIHYEDMVTDPVGTLRIAAELCGLTTRERSLPLLGDDRGCAEPYRQFMADALKNG